MFDFLTGGGKGESTRLKLQTPVCVALALLEAAQVQLDAELAVAEQEVCARCHDCCTWKHQAFGSGHCMWHTRVPGGGGLRLNCSASRVAHATC